MEGSKQFIQLSWDDIQIIVEAWPRGPAHGLSELVLADGRIVEGHNVHGRKFLRIELAGRYPDSEA